MTLLGGRVVGLTGALAGPDTEALLRGRLFHYAFIAAFIAVTGVDLAQGLTNYTEEEARVLHAVMRAGRETVLICDASEFGLVAGPSVCPLHKVQAVIAERIPGPYYPCCRENDIELLLTEAGDV